MTTQRLPLTQIRANSDQPRKLFDTKLLDELADSIKENGLAQPITVRPVQEGFEIIMGERRFRAHQRLVDRGLSDFAEIECHVKEMDDTTRDIQAILENLQRVDVTPLEEAKAFQRMIDLGMEVDTLGKKVGRQAWRIEERLRLLGLEPTILKLYECGQITEAAAFEMSKLRDHRDQQKIATLINEGTLFGWSAIKAAVQTVAEGKPQADIFGADAFTPSETCAHLRAAEEDLATINRMEQRVEVIAGLAKAGWHNGACIIATKVSRDRARLMADKLAAIRKCLLIMERELQASAAQAEIVLTAA
jgi:ParB family chromosome partitioning protein